MQISSAGIGVLMVEQNANVALAIATRAVVIERGELKFGGRRTRCAVTPAW